MPRSPGLRELDVTVLHRLVLEGLLGLSRDAQQSQENVSYLKDAAEAGELMPTKSTFFYPKLPSGLLINPLDPDEEVG
jgi:uncharacterized protein (DUF1015 family)